MEIIVATNNAHKVREIQEVFNSDIFSRYSLKTLFEELGKNIEIEETGNTLEENALIKASTVFNLVNKTTIADDTGLEIDYLNGLPGVNSARFAGEQGNDSANRIKVLELMKDVPIPKRTARFRTVICYYDNAGKNFIEGICSGLLLNEELGSNGFGYDSIFVPDGFSKSFAEMTSEEKNQISHRGKAIKNLILFLKNKLK